MGAVDPTPQHQARLTGGSQPWTPRSIRPQRVDRERDRRRHRGRADHQRSGGARLPRTHCGARGRRPGLGRLDAEQAIAAAQAFDRDGAPGPLGGVPFGVKDIIDTADLPTEWGTPIWRGHRPRRTPPAWRSRAVPARILLGKTVTTEFANLHPGPTRNPHDLARTPGGSSSGSAAAVADHMVPIALGTQTPGRPSGRPRSAACSVIGRPGASIACMASWKPRARSTRSGFWRARSRTWRSGATSCSAFRRADRRDRGAAADRVLSHPQLGAGGADHAPGGGRRRRRARAGRRARSRGLLPGDFSRLNEAHRSISSFEFARTFTFEITHHWEAISDTLRNGRLADGLACRFERYIEMQELAERCRRESNPSGKTTTC